MQGLNGLDSDMRSDLHDIVDTLSNSLPTVTAHTATATTQSNDTVAAIKLESTIQSATTNKLTAAAYAEIKRYLDENHKGWQVKCNTTPSKKLNKTTGDITWVYTEHQSSNSSVQQVPIPVPLVTPTSSTTSTHAGPLLVLNSANKTRYPQCHRSS
jgi:hypothetical protein